MFGFLLDILTFDAPDYIAPKQLDELQIKALAKKE